MTTARNTVLFGAALVAATAAIAVDHANHPVPRAQAPVAGQVQGGSAPCAAGAPAAAPCAAGAPQLVAPPPAPAQAPCAAGAPCAAAPAPSALRAPPPPPGQAPAAAPQLAAPPPAPVALPDPDAEAPDLVVDG